MKNETLLQKIRESKVQGPFKINFKQSGFGHPIPLFLKRWKQESLLFDKSLQSPQDVADYLEKYYLGKTDYGYAWKFIDERKRRNGKVLKLLDIPMPSSEAAKYNYPDDYVWLRIKPSF